MAPSHHTALAILFAAAVTPAQALTCMVMNGMTPEPQVCPDGAKCLLEYYHNMFVSNTPMCSPAGCYLGDQSALTATQAANPGMGQSFHVCDSADNCNAPPTAQQNASVCMDFDAPTSFTMPPTTMGPTTTMGPPTTMQGGQSTTMTTTMTAASGGGSTTPLTCKSQVWNSVSDEVCAVGGYCLLEYFTLSVDGSTQCSASGCFYGDMSLLEGKKQINVVADKSKEQSFYVCNSDGCNLPANAASDPEVCKNFQPAYPFVMQGTTTTSTRAPLEASEGMIPMGHVSGMKTWWGYRATPEKVYFNWTFPDSINWTGMQFFKVGGGFDALAELTSQDDQPTGAYECLVRQGSPAPDRVHCRGREMTHIVPTNLFPPEQRGQVLACTPELAARTVPGTNSSLCTYDPTNIENTSGIFTITELAFVTHVQFDKADMEDLTVEHANGMYTVRFWRTRAYPWDGPGVMSVRWAVARRGISNWTAADLVFHGLHTSTETDYVYGNDFMYADMARMAQRNASCYDEHKNAFMFASAMDDTACIAGMRDDDGVPVAAHRAASTTLAALLVAGLAAVAMA